MRLAFCWRLAREPEKYLKPLALRIHVRTGPQPAPVPSTGSDFMGWSDQILHHRVGFQPTSTRHRFLDAQRSVPRAFWVSIVNPYTCIPETRPDGAHAASTHRVVGKCTFNTTHHRPRSDPAIRVPFCLPPAMQSLGRQWYPVPSVLTGAGFPLFLPAPCPLAPWYPSAGKRRRGRPVVAVVCPASR